ncbi:transmembrane protein, putative [Medicago truncatula]|uniref:Transmembrane protein, putative n=1 Tax=Medicago truncatula TaxID=3880 RepID=A0A072V2M7_MEDTR|nr:transmembrane protein, putative [Medicago truncatula]
MKLKKINDEVLTSLYDGGKPPSYLFESLLHFAHQTFYFIFNSFLRQVFVFFIFLVIKIDYSNLSQSIIVMNYFVECTIFFIYLLSKIDCFFFSSFDSYVFVVLENARH